MEPILLQTSEADAGTRLDACLARAIEDLTRSAAAKAVEDGRVLVNGKTPNKSYKLTGHEQIEFTPEEPAPIDAVPQDIPLDVVYEDDDVCIVCKPAGLLSVPGKSGRASVLTAMRHRFPDSPSPLIVHRLDMATSGLMIIAKTMQAYHDLQRQFANHEIRKRYVAVLSRPLPDDTPKEGRVSLSIRPDLDDRPRQIVDKEHGREALTYYKQVGSNRLWLWPRTGRTHQLRLHCAHKLGLDDPIKGDTLYGTQSDRLYLHAEAISFRHPTTGKDMTFTKRAPF